MTDYEVLQRAKLYIDKMANGINPLTDETVKEDDLINNVRISRCLFYVSGVLGDVIKHGARTPRSYSSKSDKADFSIGAIDLEKIEYSETPIALTRITDKINSLINTDDMKKITYRMVTPILVTEGLLEEYITASGRKHMRPTAYGKTRGISLEQRVGKEGNNYYLAVYDLNAQHMIVDIIDKHFR